MVKEKTRKRQSATIEEAEDIILNSKNQQLIKKIMYALGANLKDQNDLIAVLKKMVRLLEADKAAEFYKPHVKEFVKQLNASFRILETHPRFLDEWVYKTEKEIYSKASQTSMRSVSAWRHATKDEYTQKSYVFFIVYSCV